MVSFSGIGDAEIEVRISQVLTLLATGDFNIHGSSTAAKLEYSRVAGRAGRAYIIGTERLGLASNPDTLGASLEWLEVDWGGGAEGDGAESGGGERDKGE